MPSPQGRVPVVGMITNELVYDDGAISPLAVAWHCALEARFAHGLRQHWSSCHHAILVAALVEETGASYAAMLYGLLHDATDGIMRDIPTLLKTPEQDALEREWTRKLWAAWELPRVATASLEVVKKADRAALLVEAELFAVPVTATAIAERLGPADPRDIVRARHLQLVMSTPALVTLHLNDWKLTRKDGTATSAQVEIWLAHYARYRDALGLPLHLVTAPTAPRAEG